jgi:FdhD protein
MVLKMPTRIPTFTGFQEYYGINSPVSLNAALRYDTTSQQEFQNTTITLTVEKTITIVINERYRIHILCTPCQLEAFVVGYLITEGLINSYHEIKKLECHMNDEILVWTWNPINNISYWREIRTSGCVGIRQQVEDLEIIKPQKMKISHEVIFKAQRRLEEAGKIWEVSGGTHMSGLFQSDGDLLYFSEDIGRHNTLDKVIGQAFIEGKDPSHMFAVISGRLSSAMITKLVRAGVPIAVSRAAPMLQALEIAKRCNVTVIGFSREPVFNIYTCPERVQLKQSP